MDSNLINTNNWYANLSQSQLLLWIGQELAPEQPLYNMVLTFDLKGSIEVSHFQAAFQLLIQKSDALRTVFELKDGRPVQRVLENFEYKIELLDWSNLSEKESEYKNWLANRTQLSFDLSKCLLDSVLIKFSENHFIWYFNQHHLTTDAWSVSVIYKQMANFYQLSLLGKLNDAPTLPVFRDYLDFEKIATTEPSRKDNQLYWTNQLERTSNIPHFYGSSNVIPTTLSERSILNIGETRTQKLREIILEKGVRCWTTHLSLFNVFLTILYAYIYRVSGQRELAIGSPAHNRPNLKFKETIGVFIEIFPLLSEVKEEDSFSTLLKRVQTETNGFLRNAQPGAVTPELNRRFNVILNYINAEFSDFNGIPMTSEWVHPEHCDPRHHLRLQVHDFDSSGSIHLYFDLNTNIFDAELRKVVPQHFLALLDAFIENRAQPIDSISMLTPEEFQKNIIDFNTNKKEEAQGNSIVEIFERQVEATPQAVAIEFKNKTYPYDTLNKKINQFTGYLQSQNIGEGNKVAVYLKRSPDFIISILGILKVGATYIPIPSDTPYQRLIYLLNDSQSELLISHTELTNQLNISSVNVLLQDTFQSDLEKFPDTNLAISISQNSPAYLIYTSGSTGQPKGVLITHHALSNYIHWATENYFHAPKPAIPFFTSVGFDLTITSIFTPFASGGKMIIYQEANSKVDLALLDVIQNNQVDFIKLTPSHLALLQGKNLCESKIKTIVVGGEDFKTELAKNINTAFGGDVKIYNEYGPTEATVGCIVHLFDQKNSNQISIPIGKPIANMEAYILDDFKNPVPKGVVGELYLAGENLAEGYWNKKDLTEKYFIENPFFPNQKIYQTGDLVRMNSKGILEFIGRKDFQVKINGRRIELGEIESNISQNPLIKNCVVEVIEQKIQAATKIHNCNRCGLPSNYPNVEFDKNGICGLCLSFENYQQKVEKYFKTEADLKKIISNIKKNRKGDYDCIVLLSGGKDSSYALAQMVELGAKVLAFTLDNGYISEQAKMNIRRVVDSLGVDHVFGRTPAMNAIFVDSLQRYSNVCNGCFKTIYTLSIQLALEKKIPYIVTGLSRGQFFETRLTEELFWNDKMAIEEIDQIILDARKSYHRTEDAVNKLLDASSMFENDEVFQEVQFLDFYRFTDVSMDAMLAYLEERLPWIRPTDTGRSTNCLINQVGIHVHKAKEGYSNYSFPYSWDVRVGHKTRQGALEEINEYIDEKEVQKIMDEIGYTEINNNQHQKYLVAYFTADAEVDFSEIQSTLSEKLPSFMVPTHFQQLENFPLTPNGKIDRSTLKKLEVEKIKSTKDHVLPQSEFEEIVAKIWEEVLVESNLGIHDDFLEIGGNSLNAIRIIARVREFFEIDLSVNLVFEYPTIFAFSKYLEDLIKLLLEEEETGS